MLIACALELELELHVTLKLTGCSTQGGSDVPAAAAVRCFVMLRRATALA